MSIPWEQARDEWAKRRIIDQHEKMIEYGIPIGVTWDDARTTREIRYQDKSYVPKPEDITIIDVDIDPGGDYQIGDMTWDHEDPSIEIAYELDGKRHSAYAELDFGKFVQEIVAVAEDLSPARRDGPHDER